MNPIRKTGVLIQLATGAHQEFMELTEQHHRSYADRHGLEFKYVEHNPAAPKRAGWGKIALILDALRQGFERVVWLDADAVIVDPAIDLSNLIDSGVGMVKHPNHRGNNCHWNSGMIVVVNHPSTLSFFEAVDAEPENANAWMEQVAINELAGRSEFSGLHVELAAAYNSTPGAAVSKHPVVWGAHGKPHEVRKSLISEWLRDMQMAESQPQLEHRNQFASFLNERDLVGEAAEIGVLRGVFSKSFLDSWRGAMLHLIDPWRRLEDYEDIANLTDDEHEAGLRETQAVLSPHKDRYRIHRMLSREAAPLFADGSLDFAYIDANHAFTAVLQDLTTWYPKVRPGGIVAGHDYLDGHLPEGVFGVKSAIRVFERQIGLVARATDETNWPSWYFVKPG